MSDVATDGFTNSFPIPAVSNTYEDQLVNVRNNVTVELLDASAYTVRANSAVQLSIRRPESTSTTYNIIMGAGSAPLDIYMPYGSTGWTLVIKGTGTATDTITLIRW